MVVQQTRGDYRRCDRLLKAIERDVKQELYDGAVVILAQHGTVLLNAAIGFTGRARERLACTP